MTLSDWVNKQSRYLHLDFFFCKLAVYFIFISVRNMMKATFHYVGDPGYMQMVRKKNYSCLDCLLGHIKQLQYSIQYCTSEVKFLEFASLHDVTCNDINITSCTEKNNYKCIVFLIRVFQQSC